MKEKIQPKDHIERMYLDLLESWQHAEYGSFLKKNPTKTLESLDLETIALKLK